MFTTNMAVLRIYLTKITSWKSFSDISLHDVVDSMLQTSGIHPYSVMKKRLLQLTQRPAYLLSSSVNGTFWQLHETPPNVMKESVRIRKFK